MSKEEENNEEYASGYGRGRSGDCVRDAFNTVWEDKDSQEYKGYCDGERDRGRYGWKSADDCGTGETKSDSGCFITTACMRACNLPDDCQVLTDLRAFRDTYVRSRMDGGSLLDEYYAVAPAIVAAVNQSDGCETEWRRIFNEIGDAVSHIRANDLPGALSSYRRLFERLKAAYLPV